MRRIFLYLNTLRYLKWQQFIYRFKLFLPPKKQVLPKKTPEINAFFWPENYFGEASFNKKNKAKFLNNEEDISKSSIWNSEKLDKLWLYNLHYFDDLNSQDNEQKKEFHLNLILRWISENPINIGIGWDSYPVSLRVVNWIKWYGRSGIHNKRIIESLYLQSKKLSSSVEYHLLGNHLIANCKALIFAGIFFKGLHGEKFLKQGVSILKKELREQFHEDGGHFELSPMYHCIMMHDLLDLVNLTNLTANEHLHSQKPLLIDIIKSGLEWMSVMTHPDGEVSYFNDSVGGIAPPVEHIFRYSKKLGIDFDRDINRSRLITLKSSGYTRLNVERHTLILDHGNIGPNYLPGHAHADSLCFEWTFKGHRIFVNRGISTYENNEDRLNQRKTYSHNTVELENKDSSEVWSSFRVAKRARAEIISSLDDGESCFLKSSHNGYQTIFKNLLHQRSISLNANALDINEEITGVHQNAISFFHLHPKIDLIMNDDFNAHLVLPDGETLFLVSSHKLIKFSSFWCQSFGNQIKTSSLKVPFIDGKHRLTVNIAQSS